MGAYLELIWEDLESLHGNVSHAGWEYTIESNWECVVKLAGNVQSSAVRNVLQSINGSVP